MHRQRVQQFRQYHRIQRPLILLNIWDAGSAAIVQSCGAKALATSSASLAWSNGYADGVHLPLEVLLSSVEKILRICAVPLSVDIEEGYSDNANEVVELVKRLVALGVVGINIEDGTQKPELLGDKISALRSVFSSEELFINARTDVFLQELVGPDERVNTTVRRAKHYIENGADGIFVPGMSVREDILTIAASIDAPLNIMTVSGQDELAELFDSNVSRITFGPSTYIDSFTVLAETASRTLGSKPASTLSYPMMNSFFEQ